jgi:putative membrane protein
MAFAVPARTANIAIWAFSAVVFLLVVGLRYTPESWKGALDVSMLPAVNATINSTVTVLLLAAFYFIRVKRNIRVHRTLNLTALVLSAIFLLTYVAYHAFAHHTSYGGANPWKTFYYVILATHIVLAGVVLPLALFVAYRGLTGDYQRHRKLARWTFPLWLYVTVTGVLVYFMISPYYAH